MSGLNVDQNWLRYISNPRLVTTKQYMLDLLKDRYQHHESVLDRLIASFQTDKDMEDFIQMQVSLYEVGYMKAVNDYRKQLEAAGIKVTVNLVDQNGTAADNR